MTMEFRILKSVSYEKYKKRHGHNDLNNGLLDAERIIHLRFQYREGMDLKWKDIPIVQEEPSDPGDFSDSFESSDGLDRCDMHETIIIDNEE